AESGSAGFNLAVTEQPSESLQTFTASAGRDTPVILMLTPDSDAVPMLRLDGVAEVKAQESAVAVICHVPLFGGSGMQKWLRSGTSAAGQPGLVSPLNPEAEAWVVVLTNVTRTGTYGGGPFTAPLMVGAPVTLVSAN